MKQLNTESKIHPDMLHIIFMLCIDKLNFYGRCERVQVRSTGSEVVDRVRSALTYSEIVGNFQGADRERFLKKVFDAISEKRWLGIMSNVTDFQR
jgi:hypothetical protein